MLGNRQESLLVRFAPHLVVTFALIVTFNGLVEFLYVPDWSMAWALLGTALYFPAYIWMALAEARGARHRYATPALLWIALVVTVMNVTLGSNALPACWALAGAFLLAAPAPFSYLGFCAVITVVSALSAQLSPTQTPLVVLSFVSRSAVPYVVARSVAAVRQLEASRQVLAEAAVAGERLRIDDELRSSLGTALEAVIAHGERAERLSRSDAAAADRELRELAGVSRRALGEARRVIRGYRRPSLRAELETVAELLSAAGIHTVLSVDAVGGMESADESHKSVVRSEVARILRDGLVRSCVVVASQREGRLRLEFQTFEVAPGTSIR